MKKIKAYWLRFWHCLSATFNLTDFQDHRMETQYIQKGYLNREITYIGCCCGKCFYGERLTKADYDYE